MIDLNEYLDRLIPACKTVFGDRLLYVGLQGSYLRGEATEDSDIDVMVIIDRLSVADLDAYRLVLEQIGHFDKSCGFLCGKDEMTHWNTLEITSLARSTKDLYGALSDYLPQTTRADAIKYVRYDLGALYHELCHRYVHADREKNIRAFRRTCKGLYFLIRDLYELESGTFAATKRELKERVCGEDRKMLSMAELPDGFDFDVAFSDVFRWAQNAIVRTERLQAQAE